MHNPYLKKTPSIHRNKKQWFESICCSLEFNLLRLTEMAELVIGERQSLEIGILEYVFSVQ